jgi:protein-tyrosine phosphatase
MSTLVAHEMDEVIPSLFVGNQQSAYGFEGKIICVLEWPYCRPDEPKHSLHLPILVGGRAPRRNLDAAATALHTLLKTDQVLVHCAQGVERGPLTAVWFLHTRRGLSIEDAYSLVMAKHPPTQNRLGWIE